MSERSKLPEVPASALRDIATDQRINRVWRRIDGELSGASPRTLRAGAAWLWAPAAAVAVFALGVFVGANWMRAQPGATTALEAEPLQPPAGPTAAPEVLPSPRERRDEPKKPARTRRLPRTPSPLPELQIAPEAPEQPTQPPAPITQTSAHWQQLYDEGEFEQARDAIETQGGFDAVLGQASPEQLFALSDLARSDNRAIALAALREVVNKYPHNPNAPIAAYQLGVMLKKAGDLAGAARAFAIYRALSPDGDFSEDALARQVEAAIEQGELVLARQLAEQYAKEFPTGERLDEFREELEAAAAYVPPTPAPDAGSAEPIRPAEPVDDGSPGDPPDAP
jgi:hypothetical protein